MRLASVLIGGREALVVAEGPAIFEVAQVIGAPSCTIADLLADLSIPARIAALLKDGHSAAPLDEDDFVWLAPSPRPSKIVGVALNNQVGSQFAVRTPTEPAYFLKPTSALTGHREPIVVPPEYGLTHPEPELAVVIGATVRDLSEADALDAVLGYTVINDITSPALKDRDSMELALPVSIGPAPDWRHVHGEEDHSLYLTYHARSKGCDTFAPMGPWLVSTDEVADPNNLKVLGLLDDSPVLEDSTANLRFSVQQVLAHLSTYMTLNPGDVVHFGTAFMPADPDRFPNVRTIDISELNGTLSVEIEGIGRLDNPIAHTRS